MVRDRDGIYGEAFRSRVEGMNIEEISIAPRSPWQNCFVERMIGSIRRECLNHVMSSMKTVCVDCSKIISAIITNPARTCP
jgi:hypothetical protein